MKKFILVLAVLLLMPVSLFAQNENHAVRGDNARYHEFDRFYITSQPDMAALAVAAEEGVNIVINLRDPSEMDWNESAAAGTLGLEYHQIPVNGRDQTLAVDPFVQINDIVRENPDARILLHCGSGNRAAAWLAYYLSEVEDMEPAQALETARANGLTNDGLADKVEALLGN